MRCNPRHHPAANESGALHATFASRELGFELEPDYSAVSDMAWTSNCVGYYCWRWNQHAARVTFFPNSSREFRSEEVIHMELESDLPMDTSTLTVWWHNHDGVRQIGYVKWHNSEIPPVLFSRPSIQELTVSEQARPQPRPLNLRNVTVNGMQASGLGRAWIALDPASQEWVDTTAEDIMRDLLAEQTNELTITTPTPSDGATIAENIRRAYSMSLSMIAGGPVDTDPTWPDYVPSTARTRWVPDRSMLHTTPEPLAFHDAHRVQPQVTMWRPPDAPDWLSTWTELREIAARLGRTLTRDPEVGTLRHRTELPANISPDRPIDEPFELVARVFRDPLEVRRFTVRVTAMMAYGQSLGTLWSSDPFEAVGRSASLSMSLGFKEGWGNLAAFRHRYLLGYDSAALATQGRDPGVIISGV